MNNKLQEKTDHQLAVLLDDTEQAMLDATGDNRMHLEKRYNAIIMVLKQRSDPGVFQKWFTGQLAASIVWPDKKEVGDGNARQQAKAAR